MRQAPGRATGFDPAFLLLWIVGALCAIGAAHQAKYHRLAAMVLLGGAGLVTCITFVWFSAPDLAITQLLVEIVTTVLILLGLRWLPKRIETAGEGLTMGVRARLRRTRDLMLAVAAGTGMTLVVYAMLMRPLPDTISRYFVENAYAEGGGRNVVNVILVDFRGFDTFGEIVVLAVVAITVFSLLRRFRPAPESVAAPEQQRVQDADDEARPDRTVGDTIADYLTIPAVIMQWLFPVIITVAIYLFLRGHDLPGGGFAAGVTMSIALILQYMAGGTRWIRGPAADPSYQLDRPRPALRRPHGHGRLALRLSVPDVALPVPGPARDRQGARRHRAPVRPRRLRGRRRGHGAHPDRPGAPVDPPPEARAGDRVPRRAEKENA